MNVRPSIAAGVAACLLLTLGVPRRAQAIDIASTVVSIGGAGVATAGIVMMASGKEANTRKTGKILMIVGFAVSGAASSSLTVLTMLLLVGGGYDQVEAIEREALAGGGPLTDALGGAFGVPSQEVLATVRTVQARQEVRTEADARAFADALIGALGQKARVSDTLATTILHDLHVERAIGVLGPRHQQLAALAGVPVEALAPLVAEELDRALAAAAVPGAIVSARAALAADAPATLDALLDRVVDEHGAELDAQIAFVTRAAGARVGPAGTGRPDLAPPTP